MGWALTHLTHIVILTHPHLTLTHPHLTITHTFRMHGAVMEWAALVKSEFGHLDYHYQWNLVCLTG